MARKRPNPAVVVKETCSDKIRHGEPPDDECLRSAASHIVHDLELLHIAWESRSLRIGWTLWFITARGLMDFFFRYERPKRNGEYQDDLLAADFLAAGVWRSLAERLDKPARYSAIRQAANKLSGHLTYSRVDLGASGGIPPSPEVHEFLLAVAAIWLDHLEPERRIWFGRGLPSGARAL